MTKAHSFDFFIRLIRQRHSDVVNAAGGLLKELAGEDIERKRAAALDMAQKTRDLRAVIANQDAPPWLDTMIQYLSLYIDGSWSGFNLLNQFIPFKAQLEAHSWVFDEQSDAAAFNFDSIYEHFKNESRIPELFDQIIVILEEIEASGQIDSVTMLGALEKVIATINKGKNGSYFSLNSSWDFLLAFLKNYMWGELSKLPVLGTALEALDKTIKETNEEMARLHQKIQSDMTRVVGTEVKALENKADFKFITYTKTGHVITHQAEGT